MSNLPDISKAAWVSQSTMLTSLWYSTNSDAFKEVRRCRMFSLYHFTENAPLWTFNHPASKNWFSFLKELGGRLKWKKARKLKYKTCFFRKGKTVQVSWTDTKTELRSKNLIENYLRGKMRGAPGKAGTAVRSWCKSDSEWRKEGREVGSRPPKPLCHIRNAWQDFQEIRRPKPASEGHLYSRNRSALELMLNSVSGCR